MDFFTEEIGLPPHASQRADDLWRTSASAGTPALNRPGTSWYFSHVLISPTAALPAYAVALLRQAYANRFRKVPHGRRIVNPQTVVHHSGAGPLPLHLSTVGQASWLDLTNGNEGRYPTPSGHQPLAARTQKLTIQMPCCRREPAEHRYAARNPQVARPSGCMAYPGQPGQTAAAARSSSTATTSPLRRRLPRPT